MAALGRICRPRPSARRSASCERELRAAAGERDPEVRLACFSRPSSTQTERSEPYIDEHRGRFGVEPICRVLDVSASAYYQRASGQRSARASRTSGCSSGSRRCTGATTTPTATARPGRLQARRRDRRPRPCQAPDARQRDPGRQAARQAVAHDDARPGGAARRRTSSIATSPPSGRTRCGWRTSPTCAAGRASCSSASSSTRSRRRVVGWQFASHMRTDLVLDALRMALTRRDPGADVQLVHHSDAGSQYTSFAFTQVLDDHDVLALDRIGRRRLRQRHGRELRRHLQDRAHRCRVWRTRAQLELAIVEWVAWFNSERLHESLADVPPAEFEQLHAAQGAIAGNGSVVALSPKPADRRHAGRIERERAGGR